MINTKFLCFIALTITIAGALSVTAQVQTEVPPEMEKTLIVLGRHLTEATVCGLSGHWLQQPSNARQGGASMACR
jgi:hypothetical protein